MGFRGRMDTCICMAESLHSSTETITTLLISYTSIQKFKKKNKKKKKERKKRKEKRVSKGELKERTVH